MRYDRGWKARKGLKIFVCILFAVIALGYVVMNLWNWLIPALFHGPMITFWQAVGLFALAKILFGHKPGGGGGWKHRAQWREKMRDHLEHLSTEDREKFRESFRNCGPWGNRGRGHEHWGNRDRGGRGERGGWGDRDRNRGYREPGTEEKGPEPPPRPGSDMA